MIQDPARIIERLNEDAIMSQELVAKKMRCSVSTIRRYELSAIKKLISGIFDNQKYFDESYTYASFDRLRTPFCYASMQMMGMNDTQTYIESIDGAMVRAEAITSIALNGGGKDFTVKLVDGSIFTLSPTVVGTLTGRKGGKGSKVKK